eukprot:899532-Pyramimonas_sp.AAC.1
MARWASKRRRPSSSSSSSSSSSLSSSTSSVLSSWLASRIVFWFEVSRAVRCRPSARVGMSWTGWWWDDALQRWQL